MKSALLLFALTLFSSCVYAQKDIYINSKKDKETVDTTANIFETSKTIYLGPGFGLDYGA